MKAFFTMFIFAYGLNAHSQVLPYNDDQFACTDGAVAQQMVADFSVDVKSFGGLELCDARKDLKKLLNDLVIIKGGRFGSGQNNVYIRNFIPADRYYDWMKSMTYGMNRGNDIPAATAYNRGGYFTMQDGWTKLSTLGRVGTVLHEARHTERYVHIPCQHGPYMGSSMQGCDRDYAYGGSHAIEMEYYARVAVLGQNFHPVYKAMARLMAVARSNFVFNNSPIRPREGLVGLEKTTGTAILFDQNKEVPRERPQVTGALKRTSYGAAIFNGQQAYSIEMYEKSGFQPLILDTYSYFKLLLPLTNPLKDMEEFDLNNKRFVVGLSKDNQITSYDFPGGKWNAPQRLSIQPMRSASFTETGARGYFLIDSQSQIYNFNPETQRLSSALSYKWNPEFVNVTLANDRLFILKTDGRIYEKSKNGELNALRSAQNLFSDLVAVTLYDGFEVHP